MSDMGGNAESLGELELDVSINDTQAQQQAQDLAKKIAGVGNAASGQAASGFRTFGSVAVTSLGGVISSAQRINTAFGSTSPLAPLMNTLTAVQGPLQNFGMYLDEDSNKMKNMQAVAMGMVGIGGVFVGIAGAITQASRPLQDANAALQNSIANTKSAITGLPDSISNYTDKIKEADSVGQHYGYSADQVNKSLSQLTEETRSAPEAFKELNFAMTLAAAPGGAYHNLSQAAALVGRMHAGLFRSLRQFGIDIPSYLINPAKEAATAEGQLEKATDSLKSSQQALADFQQKLGAAEEARQQKFQVAVTTAQNAATVAQQKYQDSLQATADAEQKSADASQKAQQTISDNASKLADDTQAAAQSVSDAQTKIADLQQKWADEDSARQTAASDKAQQTADAIAAAQEGLATSTAEWSTTPAKSAEEALRKLDTMRKQAEQLAKLQDQQAKDATAGQLPDATAIQRQQQMQAAQEALNKALETQNDLGDEAAKMQLQNQQATLAATDAQAAYTKAQQNQADAQTKMSVANEKLASSQAALASAASPTMAESQQLERLKNRVAEAQEAIDKANGKIVAANNDQQKIDQTFQDAMNQFMSREGGLLQRRASTWSGHLRTWEAGIKNAIQDLGQFAGPLATAGFAAMGVGSFIRMGGQIRDAIKTIGGGRAAKDAQDTLTNITGDIENLEKSSSASAGGGGLEQLAMDFEGLGGKAGKGATDVEDATSRIGGIGRDLSKAEGAAGEAEKVIGEGGHFGRIASSAMGLVGKVGSSMSGVGSAVAALGPLMLGPVGIVIAAIAGIAAIGFIVYKNWDTITAGLSAAWNWVFGEGKRLFGDFEAFIKQWGALILLPIAPFIALPLIIFQHWGQISGFFKRILGDITGFFSDLPGEIFNTIFNLNKTFLDIGWNIVVGIWNGLSSAGSWLYNKVKDFAKNFIESPIKDFLSIFSPSQRMAGHGDNIAKGIAQGMLGGAGEVESAALRLANAAQAPFNKPGGLTFGSPGAAIAPSMSPTQITNQYTVTIPVQGTVVAEADLQDRLKTFLQQGAQQNGGSITRFLGVPSSS